MDTSGGVVIKRYEPDQNGDMNEYPLADYVLYADHKKIVDELEDEITNSNKFAQDQENKIETLKLVIAKMREALEFYGSYENKSEKSALIDDPELGTFVTGNDWDIHVGPDWYGAFSGRKAREVLANVDEIMGKK